MYFTLKTESNQLKVNQTSSCFYKLCFVTKAVIERFNIWLVNLGDMSVQKFKSS